MITIKLTIKQQIAVVDEYWAIVHPLPNNYPQVTAEDIYKWVGLRYRCQIIDYNNNFTTFNKEAVFLNDEDLTFFLLKHGVE